MGGQGSASMQQRCGPFPSDRRPRGRRSSAAKGLGFTVPAQISAKFARRRTQQQCRRSRPSGPGPARPPPRRHDRAHLPSGYLQAEGHRPAVGRDAVTPPTSRALRGAAGAAARGAARPRRRARRRAGSAHVRELRRAAAARRRGARTVSQRGSRRCTARRWSCGMRGGKFVTVRERALAPLEPNCLRVELDEEGGAGAGSRCCRASRFGRRASPSVGDALLLAPATQQMLHVPPTTRARARVALRRRRRRRRRRRDRRRRRRRRRHQRRRRGGAR